MGAWGTKIFSDDYACDIRNYYVDLLILGKTEEEALKEVIESEYYDVKDTEEEPVFWFALAYTQWKKGRLDEYVKQRAIEFIDNGKDLIRWNTEGNEKNYNKRKIVLQELKETLLSPMPEAKKIRKPSWIYKSPWEVGDLLVYKLTDERITQKGYKTDFLGKYILLRVISIFPTNPDKLLSSDNPCAGLYGWIGDEIPDPSITDGLDFAVIMDNYNKILGRFHERVYNLQFSKKEIKRSHIEKIGTDSVFKERLPEFFIGYDKTLTRAPAYDLGFTRALENYFTKGKDWWKENDKFGSLKNRVGTEEHKNQLLEKIKKGEKL